MSLINCNICLEELCHCGHKYRNLVLDDRIFFAAAILGIPEHAIEETLAGIIPVNHPLKDSEKFIPEEEKEIG